MDVRCERCKAQYVFDDDQVTQAGLTVQCTNCGHVFKVKKKELVVTVAVKADELSSAPLPATAAAPRPSGAPATTPVPAPAIAPAPSHDAERSREWRVRQGNGNVFTFKELTTLQKWIIEQKVSRDDEISLAGDQWKRLGNIPDLASFFQIVEAAERGKAQPAMTPIPMVPMYPAQGLYPPPPSGYPPPSYLVTHTTPLPGPVLRTPPDGPPRSALRRDDGLDREERAAVRGDRGRLVLLVLALLLVAGGVGVYLFRPWWLGLAPEPGQLEVPLTVAADAGPAAPAGGPTAAAAPAIGAQATPAAAAPPPGPAADAAPANAPVPTPEPVGDAALPTSPEPVAKPDAKPAPPAAAKGPKALLAQAARLRDRGDPERALDLYGKVMETQPDNGEALAGRGLCYLDLTQYAPAEASFLAALEVDPEQPDALVGLAETYRWQGRKADAIKYYQKYLAFHPDGEEAPVARNAIDQLKE